MPSVTVKWNKNKYENVALDPALPLDLFQATLYSLTAVPPERQKIAVKGKLLKADTDLQALQIADGATLTLMGTVGQIATAPAKPVVFLEDLNDTQLAKALKIPAGLVNLGNTCYMSSTLQCLRAIPELQHALTQTTDGLGPDARANLAPSMRELFREMRDAGDGVTPLVFHNVLQLAYPQFAQRGGRGGGLMQQDAEECWVSIVSALLDAVPGLDRSRSLAPGQRFVEQFLTGEIASSMQCDEAPQEEPSRSVDRFSKLAVNISAGITTYLFAEIGNALVQHLEKTSSSLQRTAAYTKTGRFQRLPQYLAVNFVRFQWKPSEQVRAKILKKVKFPFDLDLAQFCTPELAGQLQPAKERLLAIEERKKLIKRLVAQGRPAPEAPAGTSKPSLEQLYADVGVPAALAGDVGANVSGAYELLAVLTHAGRTADSGHYIAWVRQDGAADDKDWWKYDDDKVSLVDRSEIEKLDGGGDWHSAYICLYRAKPLELPFVSAEDLAAFSLPSAPAKESGSS